MESISKNIHKTLNNGFISLYLHANGMAALTDIQRKAIQSVWGVRGSSILTGGGKAVAEVGSNIPSKGYLRYFGGKYPQEVNVDLPQSVLNTTYTASVEDSNSGKIYKNYLDNNTLLKLKNDFDGIIKIGGTYNITPFFAMQYNTDDDFSTGNYYEN